MMGAGHPPPGYAMTSRAVKCPLTRALRLAHANRWVADWLFAAAPAHPTVTPEAFASALAVNMSAHMMGAPLWPPSMAAGKEEVVFSNELDVLLVPVASMGGVVTGFAFAKGWHYCQSTASAGKKGGFFAGRFAFERASREFLMVVPGLFPGFTAILQLCFKDDVNRERNLMAVPMLDYSADSLPDIALIMMCNAETRNENVRPSFQFAAVSDDWKGALNDDKLDALAMEARITAMNTLFGDKDNDTDSIVSDILKVKPEDTPPLDEYMDMVDTAPVSSASSWSFSWDGETPDGVGVPRTPGPAPTSSGAFSMDSLTASLASIERSIKGSFFSSRAKKDIIDPVSCDILSRRTAKQYALVGAMDDDMALKFREIAAQSYYSDFLSPNPDGPLALSLPGAMGADLQIPLTAADEGPFSIGLGDGGTTVSSFSNAAPHKQREEKGTESASAAFVSGATTVTDKAEAKKIRNRLSAARSNERKRLELEAKKKELVTLHERVEELQTKREAMMEANNALKQRLMISTSTV